MVTWILEKDVFSEKCFNEMVDHFKANDIPYHIVKIIPFVHEIDGPVPQVVGPCVVYGSIGVQKLAKQNGWTVFTNENFSSSSYKKLGDMFWNNDAIIIPFSQVEANFDKLPDPFFIKPDDDNKEFAGQVISKSNFTRWRDNMIRIGYFDDHDFNVACASVKDELLFEDRIVVVNGKISSGSLYKDHGRVKSVELYEVPEGIVDLIERAQEVFVPAPVYVIDIGLDVYKNRYVIIEYNTFNSAGMYACNVGKIINDINLYMKG